MRDWNEWATVRVERADGAAWVALNRPEKRNAMNPRLNLEMREVLDAVEDDEDCAVLVLTGTGESYSAGMDLKECFRDLEDAPERERRKVRRDAGAWQWRMLRTYAKPTIAMVNGWCFGAALTTVMACDLAIAADEATFGLGEVNWGIPPGGVIARALAETVGSRDALYHVLTGRPFDGRRAAEMGLVNSSVPRVTLREEVQALAEELADKNPIVLRAAKLGFRHAIDMNWEQAEDYLYAKLDQSQLLDEDQARLQGLSAFLDEKRLRPGMGSRST